METKHLLVLGGVMAAVSIGMATWRYWPDPVPAFAIRTESGQSLAVGDMFEGKEHLLLVIVLPGCSLSKYATDKLTQLHPKVGPKLAIVGLTLMDQKGAVAFAQKESITFPVYGLRSIEDPFMLQELAKVLGSGIMDSVYGGTVLVIDQDRDVELHLDREQLRTMDKAIASLLD